MKLLFSVSNVSKQYGTKSLFENFSLAVYDSFRIGLIGRNGTGKSTLVKILLNQEAPDSGEVFFVDSLKIGSIAQAEDFLEEEIAIDYLMRTSQLEQWQCGKVAGKFMLKNEILSRPVRGLSGGYRTRLRLAAMLLKEPDFLILDEPTNYLDLETVMLLENFLTEFKGGILVVSHDREFLKKTCTHTLELLEHDWFFYPGSVEEYFDFKMIEYETIGRYNKNVEDKKKQLEKFVERFKAKATKAAQARSKQKQIDKLQTIKIEHPSSTVKMCIKDPMVKKNTFALRCEDLAVGYDGKTVAESINLEIMQSEHVALVGANGEGKSTFLKTISGKVKKKSGSYKWNTNLKIAVYEQNVYESIPSDLSVLDYLKSEADTELTQQDILDIAGSFLFKGDDVDKKVAVLSGGERARLALAGILLKKCEVLLLDEPVNHLDFQTVESLAVALKSFSGTIIFVSHDRTFSSILSTTVVEALGGKIKKIPFNYNEYVSELAKATANKQSWDENVVDASKKGDCKGDAIDSFSENKARFLEKKELKSKLNTVEKEIKNLEQQIKNLEKRKKEYLLDYEKSLTYNPQRDSEFLKITNELEEKEALWIEHSLARDELVEKI